MLSQLSIPKRKKNAAAGAEESLLDHEQLFVAGLQQVERLARHIWNDYNVHDPGITTLELLAYAITELGYRASHPIRDLLAPADGSGSPPASAFFTARRIFPTRPLTAADYRKLLIDIDGVQNAWLAPAGRTIFADTIHGELLAGRPSGAKGILDVNLSGLYEVIIEFGDDVTDDAGREEVMRKADGKLQAHRNLCEDFVRITGVATQEFVLCCELDLAPDADVTEVNARILLQVQQYLAPPVRRYTLAEMLERTMPDGELHTTDRIFDGPALDNGFIPDDELAASELRTEIRLSDIISIIMDIDGVKAIRDILINPADSSGVPGDRWVIPVNGGMQARLNRDRWRIVSYKRAMPFVPAREDVLERWDLLAARGTAAATSDDIEIPVGRFRNTAQYHSFQNHFPAIYGIGRSGIGGDADTRRRALAHQLKGYLLFFDQIMADYCAQLNHVADLFSIDSSVERTYFHQIVDSFAGYETIYRIPAADVVRALEDDVDDRDALVERRNRFLDHLISRFAERFHEFVHIMREQFGYDAADMIPYKCRFLRQYPAISGGRSIAYNHSLSGDHDLWDTGNVSGLELRLAALLGFDDFTRRDLTDVGPGDEGMYVIENILLRPMEEGDPFLPICPDPNCTTCFDVDPYSYRIHIILPAYDCRFADPEFRRWAERVIREETPAHILPKICWINRDDMLTFQQLYRDWIYLKAGVDTVGRTAKLSAFIRELFKVRNIHPAERLHDCDSPESDARFILGRSALGTMSAGDDASHVDPGGDDPAGAELQAVS